MGPWLERPAAINKEQPPQWRHKGRPRDQHGKPMEARAEAQDGSTTQGGYLALCQKCGATQRWSEKPIKVQREWPRAKCGQCKHKFEQALPNACSASARCEIADVAWRRVQCADNWT